MKIISVQTPRVLDYYISESEKELIKEKCIGGYCEVPAGNEKSLYVVIDYDPTVFATLNYYSSKVAKITKGSMYLYEYEMNTVATKGDKDFIFTGESEEFTGELSNVYMDGNSTIVMILNIK